MIDRTFSIAPMMDRTDTHFRVFMRTLTKRALLYTQMITAPALKYSDPERLLKYSTCEHPIAVQIGGSVIDEIIIATKHCQAFAYDEINFNAGCPSPRVQKGQIGAVLMKKPKLLIDCLNAISHNTDKEISLKHRISVVDKKTQISNVCEQKEYSNLKKFIEQIATKTTCKTFIIHCRSAVLGGLNPKQNREIPPIKHHYSHKIKADFPQLNIIINGEIKTVEQIKYHLNINNQKSLPNINGVMVGREAYINPYSLLSTIDRDVFNSKTEIITPLDAMKKYLPYVQEKLNEGVNLSLLMRSTVGLFKGYENARQYRQILADNMYRKNATVNVVNDALSKINFNQMDG